MLTLDQIKTRLKTANIKAVAIAANVHPNTVYGITYGQSPSYAVVKKLSDYFTSVESDK